MPRRTLLQHREMHWPRLLRLIMADQAIHCRLMDMMMLCACRRRSRESLHRLSFSMACISWPARLCSAADCSSAAATAPARGAVKCVDKKKGRSNGSFSLRPLSSLDSFCVRQSVRVRSGKFHSSETSCPVLGVSRRAESESGDRFQ